MSKPHILIIEDNPQEVELLRMALDRLAEPYELIVLADGAEALRYVRLYHAGIPEPEPCVILLDIHLPKYDGLEVLDALKREPGLREIGVVVLASGAVRSQERIRIEKMGATLRQKPGDFTGCLELAADAMDLCKGMAPAGL
jgi:CheY-like chemotaxis protein